jgi:ADP-ribose pyrophosphatase
MSTASDPSEELRSWRLKAYDELRQQRPSCFVNPPGAAFEIVFDRDAQSSVAEQSAARNRAAGIPEQYGDIGIVYQDEFVTLVKDAVRFRSGYVGPYIRFLPTSTTVTAGAAVLPVHEGRIILIRHFHHASRAWNWEIPRGFGAANEDAADTARRELSEELSAEVTRLIPLGRLRRDAGVPEDLPQLFWAEITQPGRLETEEGIDDIRAVTVAELDRMILDGELDDAFTLAALAYARVHHLLDT